MPQRRGRRRRDLLGEGLTALCGGALAFNLLLVVALLVILIANGTGLFWQRDLVQLSLDDGTQVLGELHGREPIPGDAASGFRVRIKTGNRDLGGADFRWIDESAIRERRRPQDAVLLERREWGPFFGIPVELRHGDGRLVQGSEATWQQLTEILPRKLDELAALKKFDGGELSDVNQEVERLRLAQRRLTIGSATDEAQAIEKRDLDARLVDATRRYEELTQRLNAMRQALQAQVVVFEAAGGARREISVSQIVRALRPNAMGLAGRAGLYLSRAREFLTDDPRESNTEGGIFPAIFGTVMMVFIMSIVVAPLGVLAALYLREYAKQGFLVRTVRIAVNNLAGVPSIVFGVFGLGFFVYLVGGSIDRFVYPESLPTPTFGTGGILWASLTLALLTVPVVIVATEEGLAAVPRITREGSLALGATKFETIWRVVLPAAAPGMLTGLILAMARAAGEVAPLMIVGMVKLAPTLPVDGIFPFVHLERKFMHLGFHIYDVGFQSPNVEATKPIVFATALLLILVVTAMNLVAIAIRNHLRRKYATSAV